MSTYNAIPESSMASSLAAPAAFPPSRLLYWSVRRELWENRSIYLAPLGVAGLFLFGFLFSLFRLPEKIRAAAALEPMKQRELMQQPYDIVAGLIMATTAVVGVIYCLDALYGERRDRSILFWKSLPVSDLTTVLAKATIPMVVLPLLTFAVTFVTQWIMLLLSSLVLLGSGLSVAGMWSVVTERWVMLFYHLVTVHGLWYAPIFGWLLLVSAWARRVPFLWAALPLFAIGFVERAAFNTSYLAGLLGRRLMGGPEGSSFDPGVIHPLSHLTPGRFLSSPGLWIGLALTAVFLAAAVRLRRDREPI